MNTWAPAARRSAIALAIVFLLAGTTFAAASSSPTSNPAAGAAGQLNDPTEAPEASDTPDPSETPEANEAPEAKDASEAAPSADELARIVDKLQAAGITATAGGISDLAAKVGVGGAIRVLAFAHASGKSTAQILTMFDAGNGWGVIARELKLSIGPGIGWIMGNGHGNGHGHGHDKTKP
jgi:hypothetical protein